MKSKTDLLLLVERYVAQQHPARQQRVHAILNQFVSFAWPDIAGGPDSITPDEVHERVVRFQQVAKRLENDP
jgi:hypothetical protein